MPIIRFKKINYRLPKPVTVEGKKFKSFNSACVFHNLSTKLVASRIKRGGWSLEEALELKERKIVKFTVDGKDYKSLRSVCLNYGKCPTVVGSRIKRGWTIEEALEVTKRVSSSKCEGSVYIIKNSINKKVYIGITTSSIRERFKQHQYEAEKGKGVKLHKDMRTYGIDKFSIHLLEKVTDRYELSSKEIMYINNYNSVEKGYNTLVGGCHLGERCGRYVKYNGMDFVSITSLAYYVGLPVDTTHYRVNNGIPLDQPLKQTKGQKIVYNNKNYLSIQHLADSLSLSYNIVQHRLANNICLTIPAGKAKNKKVRYKKKVYDSIKDLAFTLKVSTTSIGRMIKSGKVERITNV